MSGIDEQGVPQCPECKRSYEIGVGAETWMFPKSAKTKRGLKYSLYSRHKITVEVVPHFYKGSINCGACGARYDSDTVYYNKLKNLFDAYILKGEYYDNEGDFGSDDDESGWDYDTDFNAVLNE